MTEYWSVEARGQDDNGGVRAFNSSLNDSVLIGTIREDRRLVIRVSKEAAADFAWGILEGLGEAERPKPEIKVGDLVRYVNGLDHTSWGKVTYVYKGGSISITHYTGADALVHDADELTVLTTEEFNAEVLNAIKERLDNA